MSILSRIFTLFEAHLVPPQLNIWRTIYFNFRVLPFSQALKFPFFIYGKFRFPLLAGCVVFDNCELRKGMVKIGRQDPFDIASGDGFIGIAPAARMVFHGPANISTNCVLRVFGSGTLDIGRYIFLGSRVRIICNGGCISIGNFSRIAFNTNIINSSFHSVVNLETLKVANHIRPISIGERCWIGNGSSINGGTILKDSTIVCSGSFVSKDYTILDEENQMLGGRPAKLIKSGLARVFNPNVESSIMTYFSNNPDSTSYILTDFQNDDLGNLIKEEFE